jgi:hypothetical protein
MIEMRRMTIVALLALLCMGVTACAAEDNDEANVKADALVLAARSDGLAPELTNEIARTLYGDDGGQVCGALKRDWQPTLIGQGHMRKLTSQPDEHADELLAYDQLVVEIYCPDQLPRFEEVLDQLNVD